MFVSFKATIPEISKFVYDETLKLRRTDPYGSVRVLQVLGLTKKEAIQLI